MPGGTLILDRDVSLSGRPTACAHPNAAVSIEYASQEGRDVSFGPCDEFP